MSNVTPTQPGGPPPHLTPILATGPRDLLSIPWVTFLNMLYQMVVVPNQTRALAYQFNAGTTLPNNVFTVLTFDTNVFNRGNLHSTTVNPSRFTVTVAGCYFANASVQAPSNVGQLSIQVFKNGAANLPHTVQPYIVNNANGACVECPTILELVAGDYVEFKGFQNSGGAIVTSTNITWGSLILLSTP
jgi:hypothetical protein